MLSLQSRTSGVLKLLPAWQYQHAHNRHDYTHVRVVHAQHKNKTPMQPYSPNTAPSSSHACAGSFALSMPFTVIKTLTFHYRRRGVACRACARLCLCIFPAFCIVPVGARERVARALCPFTTTPVQWNLEWVCVCVCVLRCYSTRSAPK